MGLITQGYYYSSSSLTNAHGVCSSGDNSLYVTLPSAIKNLSKGTTIGSGQLNSPRGIETGETHLYAVTGNSIKKFTRGFENHLIKLEGVQETTHSASGDKTTNTEYAYDSYGNIITEKIHGDTSTNTDDMTVWRGFYPNETLNILDKPTSERIYTTIMETDSGGTNLRSENLYYYDSNNTVLLTPPVEGNLTRVESKINTSESISTYYTYDTEGNVLTEQDPNGNITTVTYDSSNTYIATSTKPLVGTESYTYTWGWSEGSDPGAG